MALKLSVSCSVSSPLGLLGICRTLLTTSVHPIKSAVKTWNSHKWLNIVCLIRGISHAGFPLPAAVISVCKSEEYSD